MRFLFSRRDESESIIRHLEDELNHLYNLIQYEIISPEIWDNIMSPWMEAIVNVGSEDYTHGFVVTLRKILDPDLSPLGFPPARMYDSITWRLKDIDPIVRFQALMWLQKLTEIGISVPLQQLLFMFDGGSAPSDSDSDSAHASSCSKENIHDFGQDRLPRRGKYAVDKHSSNSSHLLEERLFTGRNTATL
ncbi:hypothetical protein QAD02_007655 [Eretmocerus hayati]|uniref:Uncharacterized protein n=1 Tax=Eretmocerus hayati TaxID=131215 RepID=A0ACC2N4B6_9HYME|nr:hypothetical protein QAD02_007655 [Eretmocerus hayati]